MSDADKVFCPTTFSQDMDGSMEPSDDGEWVRFEDSDSAIKALEVELAEWRKLRDPAVLHVNLLRGMPAKLTPAQVWHLVADDRDRLAKLEAERDALRADAERYRWMRATTNFATNSAGERIDVRNKPDLWDAAIDSAKRIAK